MHRLRGQTQAHKLTDSQALLRSDEQHRFVRYFVIFEL